MHTVGIVAKGPRHVELPNHRAECSTILAINQAARWHFADWWVFGDAETFHATRPIGNPRWFIPRYAAWRLRNHRQPPEDVLWWDDFGLSETMFSAVVGLHLAAKLGASRILCFGVVDEHPQPGESPRWAREREMWDATVAGLCVPVIRA